MIIRELYNVRADGARLFRTYSDANKMILQNETNTLYSDAIDVEDAPYTYTETEQEIFIPRGMDIIINEPIEQEKVNDKRITFTLDNSVVVIVRYVLYGVDCDKQEITE